MRVQSLSFLIGLLTTLAGVPAAMASEPVPLIFDTDMGNDVDDALALGLIHALQSHGECKLLAVTVTKDNRFAAPCCDVINTFYERDAIPIGTVRGGQTPGDGSFIRTLATAEDQGRLRYPHQLRDGGEAPEATGLLRKVLAGQADGSVVIVQVGFSTNLARLLASPPDEISPLDGTALVKQKVRLLSVMAGKFSAGSATERFREYNVVTDIPSAKRVFHHWPTPMVVSGFEIGQAIVYPSRSILQDYRYALHHPVAEAYERYMKMPYDRPTWDLTSVLYAVRPGGDNFGLSSAGRVIVEDDGVTRFEPAADGPHRYLTVSPQQVKRVQETFCWLCPQRPDGFSEWEKQRAEAARKIPVHSTRTQPEPRVLLENKVLRLDFDPRTSATDYNYIWLRRPGTDRWERLHNFGVDVQGHEAGDGRVINCIGLNLMLQRDGHSLRVGYPRPLIQYRQFDDKIGRPETIRKYPDFSAPELPGLVHVDAALEFQYQLDPERPSFTISGHVTEGHIASAVYILDALWVDNPALPTHEYIDGRPEYDIARPEATACKNVAVEKEAYAIFYRHDGDGVPFALVPLQPVPARFCNYYDNWKCLYDFRTASLNQQFIPEHPPVAGCNDSGYIVTPRADGTLPGVRVVFFPELGWGRGGRGKTLRDKIVQSLKSL